MKKEIIGYVKEDNSNMNKNIENIDNNIQLFFLAGVKTGIEALVHGLEVAVVENNGQVPFEFIKMISDNTIADIELKLFNIENGKGLIKAMNNESR